MNFLADRPDSSLSPYIQLVLVARLIFPNRVFIKSLFSPSTPTAFCIHSKCLHLALRASHLRPSFFLPPSLPPPHQPHFSFLIILYQCPCLWPFTNLLTTFPPPAICSFLPLVLLYILFFLLAKPSLLSSRSCTLDLLNEHIWDLTFPGSLPGLI